MPRGSPAPARPAVLILQHIDYGNAAVVGRSLNCQGIPTFVRHLYRGEALPDRRGIAGVISMGGPMGANDEAEHPWIGPECEYLKSCVEDGIPTVGICLGGQLLAKALGARVECNPVPEVGWYPVSVTGAGLEDPVLGAAGPRPVVYHWHMDRFDLPRGAVQLASSPSCVNQAYRIGEKVYGFQFHPEADHQLIEERFEFRGNADRLARLKERHGNRGIQDPEFHRAMAPQGERAGLKITAALTQLFRAQEPYRRVGEGVRKLVESFAIQRTDLTLRLRASGGKRMTLHGRIYNLLSHRSGEFVVFEETSRRLWVARMDDIHSVAPIDSRAMRA